MKKTILKTLVMPLVMLGLISTSCSSDDNTNDNTNSSFVLDRENLKGEINQGTVILENGTYKLTGALVVKDGAKLVVKQGVTIEATPASGGDFSSVRYIAVAQGGEIDVQGTAENPVVMTSTNKTPGSWGGLVLCGKAPINKGITASAEVSELTYGGVNPQDSSGSIKYLRLEYTGFSYNSEKEFNALSFFGVGSGTTIEYVQAFEGSDDGFEWFGGTVNAKYLVVINSHEEVGDDLFDWTEGWNGTGEYWYGKRANAGNRGIEADNNSNNHLAAPISNPTIKNITLIGNGIDGGGENQALKLRVGTKAKFDNMVLANWGTGFDVQHDESISYVLDGTLEATNVKFENIGTRAKGANSAGEIADVSMIYTENATSNGAGNGTAKPIWANGWTVGF